MEKAEAARQALEKIEQAFGIRTNVRAGTLPPEHAAAYEHAQGQPFEPQVIPLYGVIINPLP
jgi:hypothetical protein